MALGFSPPFSFSGAHRMKQRVWDLFQAHQDPTDAQNSLQAEAQRHPFLRDVIRAHLDHLERVERRLRPKKVVGVIYSL